MAREFRAPSSRPSPTRAGSSGSPEGGRARFEATSRVSLDDGRQTERRTASTFEGERRCGDVAAALLEHPKLRGSRRAVPSRPALRDSSPKWCRAAACGATAPTPRLPAHAGSEPCAGDVVVSQFAANGRKVGWKRYGQDADPQPIHLQPGMIRADARARLGSVLKRNTSGGRRTYSCSVAPLLATRWYPRAKGGARRGAHDMLSLRPTVRRQPTRWQERRNRTGDEARQA